MTPRDCRSSNGPAECGSHEREGLDSVHLLNFSHPLTEVHLAQVEALARAKVERVVDVPIQLDMAAPLIEQVAAAVDGVRLTPREWQTLALVVNPPGYAPAASILLAELHGRMGYFPTLLWMRPVAESTPPRFEVAQLINLQAVRERARRQRRL